MGREGAGCEGMAAAHRQGEPLLRAVGRGKYSSFFPVSKFCRQRTDRGIEQQLTRLSKQPADN